MARVNTYLNFQGQTEEAFTFYAKIFGTEITMLSRFSDMPAMGPGELPAGERDLVMHAELPILAGCTATLPKTSHIVMEAYVFRHVPQTLLFHEMCAHMGTLGFRCFNMAEPMHRPRDQALWQMDLFFARKDDPVFASEQYR